jgi:AcrR family transcriptional regulator
MASEESKRNRIMEFAFKKFTSMGFVHVTMDDISRGVGIGKGTLYKFFPSKEELLLDTIDYFGGRIEKAIQEIMAKENLTPVEKLVIIFKTVAERFSKVNPSVIAYMERSIPEAYEKIASIRQRIIMTNLVKLFEEGKRDGLFVPEIDEYLAAHILIGAANHILDAQVLSTLNYSLDNLFNTITSTILKGCLTEEGRKQVV